MQLLEELFEKIEPLDDIKKKELKETYIKMNKCKLWFECYIYLIIEYYFPPS